MSSKISKLIRKYQIYFRVLNSRNLALRTHLSSPFLRDSDVQLRQTTVPQDPNLSDSWTSLASTSPSTELKPELYTQNVATNFLTAHTLWSVNGWFIKISQRCCRFSLKMTPWSPLQTNWTTSRNDIYINVGESSNVDVKSPMWSDGSELPWVTGSKPESHQENWK